jgi:hypothetical protein
MPKERFGWSLNWTATIGNISPFSDARVPAATAQPQPRGRMPDVELAKLTQVDPHRSLRASALGAPSLDQGAQRACSTWVRPLA